MRVFVTGATGFVGSAIVSELLAGKHRVLGLARNDAAAEKLGKLGVEVHRGDVTDPDSLVAGARACEGVIHTAFIHDFAHFEASVATEGRAVKALAAALEGSNKPFVVTSGTAIAAVPGRKTTEADACPPGVHRSESEIATLAVAARGVRSSLVRLSPTTHGAGDHGFVPMLIDLARRKGFSAYVGEGANRWPAVHRFDAARLYVLALEKAAPGTRLHAVAEEVPFRQIAETIGEGLGLPVRGLTPDQAQAHFEWFTRFASIDNPTASEVTRRTMGWTPREPGLLNDLRENGYFAATKKA